MIITEYYRTRDDGVVLNRTHSDLGYMIEREGIQYEEAIDPADLNREYIETDIPIIKEEEVVQENINDTSDNEQ